MSPFGLERLPIISVLFRGENKSGKGHIQTLEASELALLLQAKAEELNGRVNTDHGNESAYQELSWARQHSTDTAKRVRVTASKLGVTVSVSRKSVGNFLGLDVVYAGIDRDATPYGELTNKDRIELATQLAEPILRVQASNSPAAEVK